MIEMAGKIGAKARNGSCGMADTSQALLEPKSGSKTQKRNQVSGQPRSQSLALLPSDSHEGIAPHLH